MMLRHLTMATVIYVALVMQPSLPPELSVAGSRPWIPGIALVICLVLAEGSTSLIGASVLGLGVDCLSGERLGVHVMVATAVAAGVLAMKSSARFAGPVAVSTAVLAGTFAWKTTATVLYTLLGRRPIDWPNTARASLNDAIYSAIVVLFILITGRAIWASIFPERLVQFSILNRWSRLTSD